MIRTLVVLSLLILTSCFQSKEGASSRREIQSMVNTTDEICNCTIKKKGKGTIKCWGRNNHGQLGYRDNSNRGDSYSEMGHNLPYVDLGKGRTAKKIIISKKFYTPTMTCAILDNDRKIYWGGLLSISKGID